MEMHNPLVDNPNRDFADHEAMYENFVRITAIAAFHVATIVVALALGGVAGHWYWSGLWIVVATIAAIAGAMSQLEWRPGAVVLVLSIVTLAIIG